VRPTRSVALADDVVQDVFVALAVAGLSLVAQQFKLEAWLYVVARRRLVDVRRRERAAVIDVGEVEHVVARDEAQPTSDLARCIRALPPAERQVVVLHLLQGLAFEEIASAVGRTPGACRMLFGRALTRLRADLEHAGLAPEHDL
jgi:RNA polymerase sigma-70 factor (ECF subfamily)